MSRHDNSLQTDYHQAMSFPETYAKKKKKKKGGRNTYRYTIQNIYILFFTLLKCAVALTKDAA